MDQAVEGLAGLQTVAPAGEDGRPQEDSFRRRHESITHLSGPCESLVLCKFNATLCTYSIAVWILFVELMYLERIIT